MRTLLSDLWAWIKQPSSGIGLAALEWKRERTGDIASWWSHERIVQGATILIHVLVAPFYVAGWEVPALGVASLLSALVTTIYWAREVVPLVRDPGSVDPLDAGMDWIHAWWGFGETLLAIYGLIALLEGALTPPIL